MWNYITTYIIAKAHNIDTKKLKLCIDFKCKINEKRLWFQNEFTMVG